MGNSSTKTATSQNAVVQNTNPYPPSSYPTYNPNTSTLYPQSNTLNTVMPVPAIATNPPTTASPVIYPNPNLSAPIVTPAIGPPAISPVMTTVINTPDIEPPLNSSHRTPEPKKDHISPEDSLIRMVSSTLISHKIQHTPPISVARKTPGLSADDSPKDAQASTASMIPLAFKTPEIYKSLDPLQPSAAKVSAQILQSNLDRHTPDILPIASPLQTPKSSKVHPSPQPRVSSKTTTTPKPISTSPNYHLNTTDLYVSQFAVQSPDVTAMTPTSDHRSTPIKVQKETRLSPAPPVTSNISTSPRVPIKPTASVKSFNSQSKNNFTEKRPSVKKITPPSTTATTTITISSNNKRIKPPQHDDPKKIDEKPKRSLNSRERTRNIAESATPSLPKQANTERKVAPPTTPHIVAAPSYSLRSTAVCNLSDEEQEQIPKERKQSIHANPSIFRYHSNARETKPIGSHSTATMFQMNTRARETPQPTPSLLFLTKNFTDGNHKTSDNLTMGPTFGSLGLENHSENELNDDAKTDVTSDEPLKRKIRPISTKITEENDLSSFVSSSVLSKLNFQTSEKLTTRTNKTDTKPVDTSQNNTLDGPFTFPAISPRSKASQSITRSERIVHHQKKPDTAN